MKRRASYHQVKPSFPFVGNSSYCLLPLTKGLFTKIDTSDFEFLSQFNWNAIRLNHGSFYASRSVRKPVRKVFLLHRVLLNPPPGFVVDHINGDGLDNRRCNLRIATPAQNSRNAKIARHNTSGFKGVCFINGQWRAQIYPNRKTVFAGRFKTAEEAARAYDVKARELFGPFARLNFPKEAA